MKHNLKKKIKCFQCNNGKEYDNLCFINVVNKMECYLDFRVLTPPQKMENPEKKIVP